MRDSGSLVHHVGVVLIVVCLLVATAATAAPPQGLTLIYHKQAGDKAVYSFSSVNSMKMSLQQDLTTEEFKASVQMKCLAEFLEPTPDGMSRIEGQIVSGGLKIKMGEEEETEPISGVVAYYVVSPRGEIKNRELISGDSVAVPQLFSDFGPESAFLLDGFLQFPDKPVKAGDKWSGTATKDDPEGGGPETIGFQSKLLGVGQFRGRPCAKIRTFASLSMDEQVPVPEAGATAAAKIKLTVTVTWQFDYERGLLMWAEGKQEGSMTASFPNGTGSMMSVKSSFHGTMRTSLTEYNGQKLPAK